MTKKTSESAHRLSYERLRDACDTFEERLTLGEAIRNGWPSHAIEAEAQNIRSRMTIKRKRQHAIYDCSRRTYYSPDQRAADAAWLAEKVAEDAALKAVKATKATRPVIPSKDWAPIRTACLTMLDCGRLQTILDDGWKPSDVLYIARVHSEVSVHRPFVESPGAIRFALALLQGHPAGEYCGWFPRTNPTN